MYSLRGADFGSWRGATVTFALVVCLGGPGLRGQQILGSSSPSPLNIFPSDLAVLEAGEVRDDLPCTVMPQKVQLGFDLRLHAGYDVSLPLSDLAGGDNTLTVVFRVIPAAHKNEPVYFQQRVHVPYIDEKARGDATISGAFDVGEGDYHVDWLMRDRAERVCASSWDTSAGLQPRDHDVALTMPPNDIERAEGEQFQEEPPVRRAADAPPLNVKVLINFAPEDPLSPTLHEVDTGALVSILRSISRDPHIGRFSLVAFNMQDEKVMYRQGDEDKIDFPALGNALTQLKLGTVTVRQLGDKHSDIAFLSELIRKEVSEAHNRPDALIFAGPKVMLDQNVSNETLRDIGPVDFPLFYMNYNTNPQQVPWRDAIGKTVRFFHGIEYTITRPRDLWYAVNQMCSQIVKSRNEKATASISSQ
ncbi:MAG TPA: hypothetical protein VMJ34_08235 [Bryobacteraceae bacterium]|nr:hypothetical protein [Bryobacteraceae bacterium]